MLETFRKYFKKLTPQKASEIKVVVLCVLAATTFWALNALNKDNYISIVDYPIEFEYDQEEFMAIEELPSKVRVEINSDGWDLLRKHFNINVTPFTIELSNPASQDFILASTIQRSLTEALAPSKLNSIVSDTIKFRFDRIIEKDILVALDTNSQTLAPYFKYAGPIQMDPEHVHLKGPSSKIAELGDTILIPLDDDRINENYNKHLPVELSKDLRDYLTLQEKSVHVTFEVVAFLEGNKRLKLRQVNFPAHVSLVREANSVLMNYRVDERRVNELREMELEGILDYHRRNKEDSTISIELDNLPEYMESIEIEPNTFKLKYQ